MPTPDFLIIGAQKCGTTSLFYYLSQHPDLSLPEIKELQFFTFEYSKGWTWYENQFPRQSIFEKKITGEATPYYLFHPLVPKRVAQHLSKVKLIVMLRDPVERAYSHYYHEIRHHAVNTENASYALLQEDHLISDEEKALISGQIERSYSHQHHSFLSRGLYAKQIERWLQYFPLSQMLFIKSEDFFNHPEIELVNVYQFLNIKKVLPKDLKAQNTNLYPGLTSEMRTKISSFFDEDRKHLIRILGDKFSWPVHDLKI